MSARLILRLKGGLGNQLFQYAAARSIAHRNRAPLYLDAVTGFASDAYARSFCLDHFAIRAELLPEPECRRRLEWSRVSRKLRSYRERCLMQWFGRSFDPFTRSLRLSRDVVLEGYWQSERYFQDLSGELRRELRIVHELSPESQQLADRIRAESSVAVHVRRLHGFSAHGRKVTGRYGGEAAQMPVADYYRRSLDHIRGVRGPVHAFIFADAPDWARDNLRFDCPATYVSHNHAERDYEDLFLMSACRDHIIANSSFSWWGAWLSTAPGKMVCAPKNFSPYRNMRPLRDVYPPDWIVI
jgi:hypothetical protein